MNLFTFIVLLWIGCGVISTVWFHQLSLPYAHFFKLWQRAFDYMLAFITGPFGLVFNWYLSRRQ